MATITKEKLSGSTNGKQILITTTASDGTGDGGLSTANVIHTAVANATDWDEVWLWAKNTHSGDVMLTIEWGETTANNIIKVNLDEDAGLVQIIPGLIIQNSLEIRCFAATANVVAISGFVNRIDY